MKKTPSELELAWEEVTFWQDYVEWLKAENKGPPHARVTEALENAWRRYEKALHQNRKRDV